MALNLKFELEIEHEFEIEQEGHTGGFGWGGQEGKMM